MLKALFSRNGAWGAGALGVSVCALTLPLGAGSASAAVVRHKCTYSYNSDCFAQWAEEVAGGAPEDVHMFEIYSPGGLPVLWADVPAPAQQGDAILFEGLKPPLVPPAPLLPLTQAQVDHCKADPIADLMLPVGDPLKGCSDVARIVNVADPLACGGLGCTIAEIWLASDGASAADLMQVPPLPLAPYVPLIEASFESGILFAGLPTSDFFGKIKSTRRLNGIPGTFTVQLRSDNIPGSGFSDVFNGTWF